MVQAPITSAVIIGEMTDATGMRLPLLLAALIAYGVSRLFQREVAVSRHGARLPGAPDSAELTRAGREQAAQDDLGRAPAAHAGRERRWPRSITFSSTSMARPCTAAHTARPSAWSCSAAPISSPMASAFSAQRGKLVAVGQLAAEHQPRQRRALRDEAHIGGADGGDLVGFGAWRLGRLADLLAQFVEAFDGQFHQQRLVIGKVAIGRGMADAGLARHGPQGQRRQRFFFQDGARGFQQAVAQIAVMIGTAAAARRRRRSVARVSRSLFMISKPL